MSRAKQASKMSDIIGQDAYIPHYIYMTHLARRFEYFMNFIKGVVV